MGIKPTKPDFRFDYKKYESKQLTVEKLDAAFESFSSPSSTLVGQIVSVIRLAAFALYLWTRRGLVNEKELIEKQEYERKRVSQSSGDIEEDDLDQLRVKPQV